MSTDESLPGEQVPDAVRRGSEGVEHDPVREIMHIKGGIRTIPHCRNSGEAPHVWAAQEDLTFTCNTCGINRTAVELARNDHGGHSDFDFDPHVVMADTAPTFNDSDLIGVVQRQQPITFEDPDCPPNQIFYIEEKDVIPQQWVAFMKRYEEVAKPNPRAELLDEAKKIVLTDRNQDYGDPEDNFRDIAAMATIMFEGVTTFEPHHAAIMGIIIKMSRLKTSPKKMDHWTDVAGYSACGWDCIARGEIRIRAASHSDDGGKIVDPNDLF
jgi:hypothetical protein